jgi:hypothetical protein
LFDYSLTSAQAESLAKSICEGMDLESACPARYDDMAGVLTPDRAGQIVQDAIVTAGVGSLYKAVAAAVRGSGQLWTQANGAIVPVLQNGTGRYDVVVDGDRATDHYIYPRSPSTDSRTTTGGRNDRRPSCLLLLRSSS